MSDAAFRQLPSVDRVLSDARLADRTANGLVASFAREALDAARRHVAAGADAPTLDDIIVDVSARLDAALQAPLRPLINATGIIIHTNLGRAPLAEEAITAMADASRGYTNLEYDAATGRRGSRHTLLEPLLCRLTGAEAAMAVNNNASALLLVLSAVCASREVVISRGELVEIGGGFRVPDVMRQSRARLVEVGTTNRTRIADFEGAITPKTAALMRVHASNFRIVGFTESATLDALAVLARDRGLLLLDDLGSGCLLDATRYGLAPEPRPQDSIAAGADVVMFSGDKLLGGPQAGVIVGRKAALDRLKKHPLARAVRLDKATIAGLAATLRIYLEGRAERDIPVWRMIAMPQDVIAARASTMAHALGGAASVREGESMAGGGSLPSESLPTTLVVLAGSATRVAARLRQRGVVARVHEGSVLLDPRTIAPAEDEALVRTVLASL